MKAKMDNSQIEETIEKLVIGEIEKIVVNKEDFMKFREIWLNHPEKNLIIGKANHYGEVSYYYKSIK